MHRVTSAHLLVTILFDYSSAMAPNGLEAARVLRDVRIRIEDVNITAEVGYVAFASLGIAHRKVSRKRLYD